jgi:hypothetical protein
MTIEEAIKHCEEKASGCSECAKEHAQLAEWLKELVKLRKNHAKYEKALKLAADYINDCGDCPVKECGGITSGENMDECPKKIISAWKRKAGIEVADNENE